MFLETPAFPACPNFGAQGQPMYSVTVITTASGKERRNRNWQRSLLQFDCTIGPRAEDTVQEILEWWHAMGGRECGFRFRDWTDYKSCRTNATPANTDQPMLLIDATHYQLIKEYTAGARTQVRKILKPINGTVLLSTAGTIDYNTGIVTFGSAPTNPTWGGEFDVPVRFNSEFPVQVAEFEVQSVTFSLQELRDPIDDAIGSGGSGGGGGGGGPVTAITTGANSTAFWGGAPLHGTPSAPHGDGVAFTDGLTNGPGPAYGSITPTGATIAGAVVSGLGWLHDNGTSYFGVVLPGALAQSAFTSIQLTAPGGYTSALFNTASATYFDSNSAQPGFTIWLWTDADIYASPGPSGTQPMTVTVV